MATLETYKNGPDVLLTTVAEDTGKCLAPGRWVSQGSGDDILGLGIVVGVTDDEVAVLWSKPPMALQPLDLKYNPLAYDEDIWIPVGTPKEEVDQFLSPPRPDPENDAWVLRQLKRMAGIK